jgi:hypothetical protein
VDNDRAFSHDCNILFGIQERREMILVHIQSAMASQSHFEHLEIQGLQFPGIVRFMKQLAHISGPLKRDLPCSPEKEIATSVNRERT